MDKPDFDIVFNNTDGQSYTYNLAGLITQIAAFEDSNNVTQED